MRRRPSPGYGLAGISHNLHVCPGVEVASGLVSGRRPRSGRLEGDSGMELVDPQDAFFLHVETPAVPQHVIGLAFLDPSTTPSGVIGLNDVIRSVEDRLPRV